MTSPFFFFDRDALQELASKFAGDYGRADPFPHVVIDDFLPADVIDRVLEEFPRPGDDVWHRYENEREQKLELHADERMGPFTRHLFGQFNSSACVEFLETLTGIPGLVPDPHLWGGGLHQIERGGLLKVHADFNLHDRLQLERRLNMLVYLNPGWVEEYGGHLELWSSDMERCEKRILPKVNRCVVFSTTDWSFHGHPEPLTCPPEMTRRSLALYYYSRSRPPEEQRPPHSTLFQKRPGEDWAEPVEMAGPPALPVPSRGRWVPPLVSEWRQSVKTIARTVLPPAAADGVRVLRDRLRRGG